MVIRIIYNYISCVQRNNRNTGSHEHESDREGTEKEERVGKKIKEKQNRWFERSIGVGQSLEMGFGGSVG